MRSIQKCAFFCQILAFCNACSPNMAMSSDSRSKFLKFLFCPNSKFYFRKSHKISSGKALYFRSYQQKTSRGCKTPPPLSALTLRVKKKHCSAVVVQKPCSICFITRCDLYHRIIVYYYEETKEMIHASVNLKRDVYEAKQSSFSVTYE